LTVDAGRVCADVGIVGATLVHPSIQSAEQRDFATTSCAVARARVGAVDLV
jgi:hypothetical protein